jgi:hypothetical protein
MADLKEQCICLQYYFKAEKTAPETHKMLKTGFGDNVIGRRQTFE